MRPVPSAAVAVFALGCWATAHAAQSTLLIFESAGELAKRDDHGVAGAAYWKDYADYARALTDAGVLRGGAALLPTPEASFGNERLGGYFVIDTPTASEAARWANAAPAVRSGGHVSVVPHAVSPAMATTGTAPK